MTTVNEIISGLANDSVNFFYTADDQTWLSSYATILGAGNLFKLDRDAVAIELAPTAPLGTEGGEDLVGTGEADFFTPGTGDDKIKGGSGRDDKNDFVSYAGLAESLTIKLNKKAKTDNFKDKIKKVEHAAGGLEADIIKGNGGKNVLFGDAGDDEIKGGGGRDILIGGAGADVLKGGGGFDFASYAAEELNTFNFGVKIDLDAGTGTTVDNFPPITTGVHAEGDTLKSIEGVIGSNGRDEISGTKKGKNVLIGLDGDDDLRTFKGKDQLFGGQRNDTLDGGRGGDLLDGGEGFDTANYSNSIKGVDVNLETGTGQGLGRGKRKSDAHKDSLKSIEALIGSDFDDILKGNAEDNNFVGGKGADQIDGGEGVDKAIYSSSDAGIKIDLTLNTASGGQAEGDQLTGIEDISASGFADELIGDSKNNRFFGLNGNDILSAKDGVDTLSGGSGDDKLFGGAGIDFLQGGTGADELDGGEGDDSAQYSTSLESVIIDLSVVNAEGFSIGVGGDAEGDKLKDIENIQGSASGDVLTGNNANNILNGNNGDDTLLGLGGNDVLRGSLGDDLLDGGDGDDSLFGDFGDDVFIGSLGSDTINDNSGLADTVDYSALNVLIEADLVAGTVKKDLNDDGDFDDPEDKIDTIFGIENIIGGTKGIKIIGEDGLVSSVFTGQQGIEIIEAGGGIDTIDYSGSDAAITLDLSVVDVDGFATGFGGHAEGDKLKDIENIIGSDFADILTGTNSSSATVFEGRGGADTMTGVNGFNKASYASSTLGVTVDLKLEGIAQTSAGDADGDILTNINGLIGSDFDDVLIGKGDGSELQGGAGNDVLNGGAGKFTDSLFGGTGSDTFVFDQGGTGQVHLVDFSFEEQDKIRIDVDGITAFSDLTLTENENDIGNIFVTTTITFGDADAGTILLTNITIAELETNQNLFEFV